LVFIRTKNIKGHQYAYLVKNIWNEDSKKVQQVTIKYLGNVSKLKIEHIPKEYESNPYVKEFLDTYYNKGKEDGKFDDSIKEKVFKYLSVHDIESLIEIYEDYVKYHQLDTFYDKIMIPILHEIGDLWQSGKLDVVTEHICSNAVLSLIKIINEKTLKLRKTHLAKKVLICTPQGELHIIGCSMIESLLLKKGYIVYNASPSAPSDSIISYLRSKDIDLLIISFTLMEHKRMVKKMVKEIRDGIKIPIIIGGRGVSSLANDSELSGISDIHPLEKPVGEIVQIVNKII